MNIIRKAYKVWHPDDLELSDVFDDYDLVYAETRNKARANKSMSRDLYMRTKAIRDKENDIVIFEGKEEKRWRALEIARNRQQKADRIKLIESYPDGETFYAQRQRETVGNAVLLWRKGNAGYCCAFTDAEEYTKEEAIKQFADVGSNVTLWPKSHIMNCLKTVVECQLLNRKFAL